jgi:hypothetical protein
MDPLMILNLKLSQALTLSSTKSILIWTLLHGPEDSSLTFCDYCLLIDTSLLHRDLHMHRFITI